MLSEASRIANDHIRLVLADATRLPFRGGRFGLAFLSMVYHHFTDPGSALDEVRRVLSDDGVLCLRTSTRDALDQVLYARFFPSALEYNRNRLPSHEEISATAKRSGFTLQEHQVIEHPFADTDDEYLEKIGQRVLSDLVATPDTEFRLGLDALSDALLRVPGTVKLTEPIDFYVFEAR